MHRWLPVLLVAACGPAPLPDDAPYEACEGTGEIALETADGARVPWAHHARTWDALGRLTVDHVRYTERPFDDTRAHHYYEGGHLTRTLIDRYDDGTADVSITYARDRDGRLVHQTEVRDGRGTIRTLSYDDRGRVSHEAVWDDSRVLRQEVRHRFTARADGGWTDARQVVTPDGTPQLWEITTHDRQGRVTASVLDRWGNGEARYHTTQAWGAGAQLLRAHRTGTSPRGVFAEARQEQDFEDGRLVFTFSWEDDAAGPLATFTDWSYDCRP